MIHMSRPRTTDSILYVIHATQHSVANNQLMQCDTYNTQTIAWIYHWSKPLKNPVKWVSLNEEAVGLEVELITMSLNNFDNNF